MEGTTKITADVKSIVEEQMRADYSLSTSSTPNQQRSRTLSAHHSEMQDYSWLDVSWKFVLSSDKGCE